MHQAMAPIVASNNAHLRQLVLAAMEEHGYCANLNAIDVSNIDDFTDVFKGLPFNGDVSRWDMSKAIDTQGMFENSAFAGDVSDWRLPRLWTASNMFKGSPFNGDVSKWGVVGLTECEGMFNTPSFHGDLSLWSMQNMRVHRNMLHYQFHGKLPFIETNKAYLDYSPLFGGRFYFEKHLATAPFSFGHASALVTANPVYIDQNEWASPELLRWAKEHMDLGRGLGMSDTEMVHFLVKEHGTQTQPRNAPFEVDNQVFSSHEWNL